MIPKLNQVAIWQPIKNNELDIRAHDKYRYIDTDGIVKSNSPVMVNKKVGDLKRIDTRTIYRYAKNYESKDAKYSLLLVTHDNNAKDVEDFLDSIKVKKPSKEFRYLEVQYGDKK